MVLIIDFLQNIEVAIITSSICFVEIIHISLHYATLHTCIKPTVHSIRNFDN